MIEKLLYFLIMEKLSNYKIKIREDLVIEVPAIICSDYSKMCTEMCPLHNCCGDLPDPRDPMEGLKNFSTFCCDRMKTEELFKQKNHLGEWEEDDEPTSIPLIPTLSAVKTIFKCFGIDDIFSAIIKRNPGIDLKLFEEIKALTLIKHLCSHKDCYSVDGSKCSESVKDCPLRSYFEERRSS